MRAKTPTMGPTIAPIGVDLCDGGDVMEGDGLEVEPELEPDADELGFTEPGGFGVTRK
jgi:hypothetical protein